MRGSEGTEPERVLAWSKLSLRSRLLSSSECERLQRTQLAPGGRSYRQEDGGAGLTSGILTATPGGSALPVPGGVASGPEAQSAGT